MSITPWPTSWATQPIKEAWLIREAHMRMRSGSRVPEMLAIITTHRRSSITESERHRLSLTGLRPRAREVCSFIFQLSRTCRTTGTAAWHSTSAKSTTSKIASSISSASSPKMCLTKSSSTPNLPSRTRTIITTEKCRKWESKKWTVLCATIHSQRTMKT